MGNVCCGGKDEANKKTLLSDPSDNEYTTSSSNNNNYDPSGTDPYNNDRLNANNINDPHQLLQQQQYQSNYQSSSASLLNQQQQQQIDDELYIAMRAEQSRLERIVQEAGQMMVSIRSTRGSTGYYDQGFAAALWQHLEQTQAFAVGIRRSSRHLTQSSDLHYPETLVSMPLPKPVIPITSSIRTIVVDDEDLDTSGDSHYHESVTTVETNNTTAADIVRRANNSNAVMERLSQPMWYNFDLKQLEEGILMNSTTSGGSMGQLFSLKDPLTMIDAIAESFLDSVLIPRERLFDGSGPIIENLP